MSTDETCNQLQVLATMKNGLAETGIMKTGYEDAKWILLGQPGRILYRVWWVRCNTTEIMRAARNPTIFAHNIDLLRKSFKPLFTGSKGTLLCSYCFNSLPLFTIFQTSTLKCPVMPTTNDSQPTYNQNSHIKIRVFCKVTPYRLVNCYWTSQIIYLPVDTTLTPRNSATFSNTAVRTCLSRKTYLARVGLWRRFPSLTTSLPVSCCCCDFARTYCGVAIAIACCFVYKHQVEAL